MSTCFFYSLDYTRLHMVAQTVSSLGGPWCGSCQCCFVFSLFTVLILKCVCDTTVLTALEGKMAR